MQIQSTLKYQGTNKYKHPYLLHPISTKQKRKMFFRTISITILLVLLYNISCLQIEPRRPFTPPRGGDPSPPVIPYTPSPYPPPSPYPYPTRGPERRPYRDECLNHGALVHDSYNGPLQTIWNCKLNRQPCELKNGVHFIPFENEVTREKDTLVVHLDRAAQILDGKRAQPRPKVQFRASRLWTKNYFPARYRNACLHISYLMTGQHHKQLYVLQRNQMDKCVYSAESHGTSYTSWVDAEIQLDLKCGDARFVIDFEYDLPSNTDYNSMGMIEIRKMSLAYGNCTRNDGNECDYLLSLIHI